MLTKFMHFHCYANEIRLVFLNLVRMFRIQNSIERISTVISNTSYIAPYVWMSNCQTHVCIILLLIGCHYALYVRHYYLTYDNSHDTKFKHLA